MRGSGLVRLIARPVACLAAAAALLAGPAGSAGASGAVEHHLRLQRPTIVAGETERARETVQNDGASTINVMVWWRITYGCGGGIVGDPFSRQVAPGARVSWDLQLSTPEGCTGTYRVAAFVQASDGSGHGRDVKTFTAT